jgi:hypothetical protein
MINLKLRSLAFPFVDRPNAKNQDGYRRSPSWRHRASGRDTGLTPLSGRMADV